MTVFYRIILTICIIFLTNACKHDLENISLNGEWQAPLAYADMNLLDLNSDSILVTDSSGGLVLNWEETLADYSLGGLIEAIETGLEKTIKLKTINLGTTSVNESLSLGQLAKDAGFVGQVIIASHGTESTIPAINNLGSSSFPVDASEYFESMTLQEGILVLRFDNGFPIDITNLEYQIKNEVGGQVIFHDTIDTLFAGSFEERTYDLDGKTLEGLLSANIIDMASPGSYGQDVLIDTSNTIDISMIIKDLVPSSATAIFPQQQIANDTSEHPVEVDDKLKLNRMILRSGTFELVANSTIQDTVRFIYQLPGMTLNGVPFSTSGKLPPAPAGGVSTITELVDFTGYTLDLTSQFGDTVNTFYDIFQAWIDSSGNLTYLSLDDSIYINSFTTNVLPERAYGQILRDTLTLDLDTVKSELFDSYLGGLLLLEELSASLKIENSFGVEAKLKPNSLTSIGKLGTVPLSSNSIGSYLDIAAADELSLGGPVASSYSSVKWDEQNSNIKDLVEALPEALSYDAEIIVNPNNDLNEAFLLYDQGIKSILDLEIPLKFGFDQFLLQDTVDFNLNLDEEFDLEGVLKVYVENEFPYTVDLVLNFYDGFNNQVLSLDGFPIILEGEVNGGDKVEFPSFQETTWPLSSSEIEALRDAEKVVFEARLNSPNGSVSKIYSDYSLNLNLVGEWSKK